MELDSKSLLVKLLLAAGCLLVVGSCSPSETENDIKVIIGATLFDGTGGDPLENSVVVIENDRIECVGAEDECEIPPTAEEINADDKYITPGMIDAHMHFFQTGFFDSRPDAMDLTDTYPFAEVAAYQKQYPQRYYDSYLCSGVTGVYDVGGFSWSIDFQDEAEKNREAPHVAAAGPLITPASEGPFDLPSEKALVTLDSEEAGIKTVQYLSDLGSTGIKFWQLDVDSDDYMQRVEATAEKVREHDNQLIAHATTLDQAKDALRNEAKLLVHSVSDQEVDDEFLELAKENDTVYNPTLIVSSGYIMAYRATADIAPLEIDDPRGCVDSKTRELLDLAPQFRDHERFTESFLERLENFDPEEDRVSETDVENLKKVYEAGIPIAVGTDAGNPGTLHGISIFEEMEAMQSAGISPEDLIVMATQNGAKAMQRDDDFGTLETGKMANLLLLDNNPADDIAHMRSLSDVIIKGKMITRD